MSIYILIHCKRVTSAEQLSSMSTCNCDVVAWWLPTWQYPSGRERRSGPVLSTQSTNETGRVNMNWSYLITFRIWKYIQHTTCTSFLIVAPPPKKKTRSNHLLSSYIFISQAWSLTSISDNPVMLDMTKAWGGFWYNWFQPNTIHPVSALRHTTMYNIYKYVHVWTWMDVWTSTYPRTQSGPEVFGCQTKVV